MSSILEGQLAAEVANRLATAGATYDVTLERVIPGEPDPEQPWLPVEDTIITVPARGWVDAWDTELIAAQLVGENDVKIVVLVDSLGSFWPEPPDTVEARGTVYTILGVEADPARATVTLRAQEA